MAHRWIEIRNSFVSDYIQVDMLIWLLQAIAFQYCSLLGQTKKILWQSSEWSNHVPIEQESQRWMQHTMPLLGPQSLNYEEVNDLC